MFKIALTDCPWKFSNRNNLATKFGQGMNIYPGMTEQELIEVYTQYLEPIMDKDCGIISWVVGPKIDQYFRILDAMKTFGFRHATKLFSWVKLSKSGIERKLPGFYSMSNTEDAYLMVRGSLEVKKKGISQIITEEFENPEEVFYGECLKPHSAKPKEVRDKIEQMFGLKEFNTSGIELFSRAKSKIEGSWFNCGNEVPPNFLDIKDGLLEAKEILRIYTQITS